MARKRLIDANEVKKRIWYGNSDPSSMRQYASKFIDKAPTVDAVEVVRCKDCEVHMKKNFWMLVASIRFAPAEKGKTNDLVIFARADVGYRGAVVAVFSWLICVAICWVTSVRW